MTNLDLDVGTIVEAACVVTDSDLNIVAKGPNIIIHQNEEVLSHMSDWCKENFPQVNNVN